MSIIKNKISGFCDDPSFEFDINNEYYINYVDLEITEEEHTHKFIEFVYTLSGKGIHTVDGRDYHVKSGDMIVINHNRTHKVTPIEGFRYVDIMLKPEYVDSTLVGTNDLFLLLTLNDFSDLSSSVIKDNLLMHFDGEEKRKIEFLIEWTGKEQSANAPASGLILHSALSMLLCLIFRKMTENQSERFKINEHLLDFIRKNCSERLSIKEIALKCGYTPEHFSVIEKTERVPRLSELNFTYEFLIAVYA